MMVSNCFHMWKASLIAIFVVLVFASGQCPAASTGKQTYNAPIGRRIETGGVLTVMVKPQRHISLVVRNAHQGESSATIHALKNNIPVMVQSMGDNVIHLEKLWDEKEISFEEKTNPDSLQVEVTNGMIYVVVNQKSPIWEKEQSKEIFLREPVEFGFLTRPKLNITCQLVANSQDNPESKLKVTFFKDEYETPVLSEEISLKNGQSRQWQFNADQNILSGEVDVKKGDVQFYLHQFSKKAPPEQPTVQKTPKPTNTHAAEATPTLKPSKRSATSSGAGKPTAPSDTIFNGEVPLMQGAKVLKKMSHGATSRVDLEVPADPEAVVNFYKQAMSAKGWQPGMAMVQGPMGVLQLNKGGSQMTLKVKGDGQKSKVNMVVME
jgi:hypothetical protein